MRVVFSDETGTGSIAKEPVSVVVALMLNVDSQWEGLWRDCDKALALIEGDSGPAEAKGRRLLRRLRRKGDARLVKGLPILLSLLKEHGIPVFYGAVDRVGFNKRLERKFPHGIRQFVASYMEENEVDQESAKLLSEFFNIFPPPKDAGAAAFGLCVEQVEKYIHTLLPREKVLWISDRTCAERSIKSAGRFHGLSSAIQRMWPLLDNPTNEGIVRQEDIFGHIIDPIYFGDSKESLMLQLADVCCSIVSGHLNEDNLVEPYYQVLCEALTAEPPVRFAPKQE